MKFANPYIFIIFVLVIGNTNAKSENIHLKYSPREDASFLVEKSIIGIADNPSSIGLIFFSMKSSRTFKDETGNKHGRLLVLERAPNNIHGCAMWKCKCDCGNEAITQGRFLRTGRTASCGCIVKGTKRTGNGASRRLFYILRSGARGRKLKFEIDYEFFDHISKLKCSYCGREPYEKHYAYYKTRYSRGIDTDECIMINSIDRKDNLLGYTKENSIPCCSMCNGLKSNFKIDLFLNQVKLIYENLKL